MAFGTLDSAGDGAPMAEINMIPLIDVMLVLLVIFIITAPLLTHSVKIDLPRASSAPSATLPHTIQLGIRANGDLYWNGELMPARALPSRLAEVVRANRDSELHIRADRTTPYENVARVMSAAARAGLVKIGFITDPTGEH